jgi:hypothetical protein
MITIALPPRASRSKFFSGLTIKHHRLSNTSSPRVIFVGGSNLAFGLDNDLIEKELCIPVVNMGLCSTFSLRYDLEVENLLTFSFLKAA